MTICLHNPTSRIPYSCQRYLGNEKSFRRSAGLINSFEISERENLDLLWGCGLYPCSNKTREVLGNLFRSPRDFLRHKLSQKENKSHFISILWMERFQIPYDQVTNYLDKTAIFSCTWKNFFRQIFGFQIVLYGGCDGGSCKKFQKTLIVVPFLGAS